MTHSLLDEHVGLVKTLAVIIAGLLQYRRLSMVHNHLLSFPPQSLHSDIQFPPLPQALYDTLVEELHTHIYHKWKNIDQSRYLLDDGMLDHGEGRCRDMGLKATGTASRYDESWIRGSIRPHILLMCGFIRTVFATALSRCINIMNPAVLHAWAYTNRRNVSSATRAREPVHEDGAAPPCLHGDLLHSKTYAALGRSHCRHGCHHVRFTCGRQCPSWSWLRQSAFVQACVYCMYGCSKFHQHLTTFICALPDTPTPFPRPQLLRSLRRKICTHPAWSVTYVRRVQPMGIEICQATSTYAS